MFEVNIRFIGGLLSCYAFTGERVCIMYIMLLCSGSRHYLKVYRILKLMNAQYDVTDFLIGFIYSTCIWTLMCVSDSVH